MALAIADEATIASLDRHRATLACADRSAADDRCARRSSCSRPAKPIYYLVSGMHSPENGGPEMLIELAYRLIVEETPFIQNIRSNVITLITPVHRSGRPREAGRHLLLQQEARAGRRAAAADVLGQVRPARQQPRRDGPVPRADARRSRALTLDLASDDRSTTCTKRRPTCTRRRAPGPYNDALDPITVSEWWMLAAERRAGDDQAQRARRLDLRVLRRLGAELHDLHRAQPQRDRAVLRGAGLRPGPLRRPARARTSSARSGSGPNPPLPFIKWGPRNNTNIQQSAVLFSLAHVAKNRQLYLENYWLKNKRVGREGQERAGARAG